MTEGTRTGAGYEIRARGHLDAHWRAWFAGWTLTNLESGEVRLWIDAIDQAGLHGALNRIRDLNLTLISVVRVAAEPDATAGES